jgi:hypothetical protein
MSSQHKGNDEAPPETRAVSPGDTKGVPVPNEDPVEGTSEEFTAVDGIRTAPDSIDEQAPDPQPAAGDDRDLTK